MLKGPVGLSAKLLVPFPQSSFCNRLGKILIAQSHPMMLLERAIHPNVFFLARDSTAINQMRKEKWD